MHAAAGGVGIAAVQIGKALGARVIGTAGGADKLEVVRRVGADVAIDYRADDWVERVKEATGGHGADVIYDSVGGDVTDASLKCIAWNGRLLVIGFASGRIPEVKLNRVLLKNISLVGLHWGAHAMHEPARIDETFRALFALYANGRGRAGDLRALPARPSCPRRWRRSGRAGATARSSSRRRPAHGASAPAVLAPARSSP